MYELAEFLSRRYPKIYNVARHQPSPGDFGWYGEGQVKTVTIIPLGVTYELDEANPMKICALL